jgi:hypothetical protein
MTSEEKPITRYDVFVPGAFPQYSYVSRVFHRPRTQKLFDPEEDIKKALKQTGMIAQVVGPSKSGKTRAVENCVGTHNIVLIAGSQITDSVPLWDIVLRILQESSEVEVAEAAGSTIGGEAKVSVGGNVPLLAKAEAEATGKYEKTKEQTKTTTYAVDPFQVATLQLIARNKVLFIDDFHTIPLELQPTVAAQLKAAAQLGVQICLAEVPHHSDSTISALPDLTARVQKTQFQYWSQSDLAAIGANGFRELNVTLSPATLEALALEAAGSPQLMQLICLNVAEFLEVDTKLPQMTTHQLDISQIRYVLVSTHDAIDRDRIFSLLDRGPDERGKKRGRYPMVGIDEGDNYEIALAAISLSPPSASLTWAGSNDNLSKRIDKVCRETKKPAKEQIVRALKQMQTLAEEHMPRQPIIEWSDSTGLHILDPYFLFYLRWSEKYEPVRMHISN